MGYHKNKSLSLSEISSLEGAILSSNHSRTTRRLQAVLFRSKGLTKDVIADLLGYSSYHVQEIWTTYFNNGLDALLGKQHGGRRRFYLTSSEEADLLEKHKQPAVNGSILEIDAIYKELCNAIGKPISKSSAYRIAKKHGWRKLSPRPHHPNNNKESSYFFKAFFPSISSGSEG